MTEILETPGACFNRVSVVVAAAAALGLSFYARRRIGPRRWRRLHKLTIVVYLLSVAHTVGAGTDAGTPWLRALLVITGAPVLFLFVMRVLPRERERAARPAPITASAAP